MRLKDDRKITKLRYEYFNDKKLIGENVELRLPKMLDLAINALGTDVPFRIRLSMALSEVGVTFSMLNNKIQLPTIKNGNITEKFTPITTNQIILMFADSGDNKDKSLNTLRKASRRAINKIVKVMDSKNIKLAKSKCIIATGKDKKWLDYYRKITDIYPSISTERGAIKYSSTLNEIGLGSLNIYSSELGSALAGGKADIWDLLTAIAIGYDLGIIPRKLVATDDLQIGNIKGLNVNATMFSSLKTLKSDINTKEKFIRKMEEQLARRGLILVSNTKIKKRDFDTLEEADKYVLVRDEYSGNALEELENLIFNNVVSVGFNKMIKMPLDVYLEFDRYKELNASRFDSIPKANSLYGLAVKHAQWRALKLSGIIAMSKGELEITLEDYHEAISIIEFILSDIKLLQEALNKDRNEDFIEHCNDMAEDGKFFISKYQIIKQKFVHGSTDKAIAELVEYCNAEDKGSYTYSKKRQKVRFIQPQILIRKEEVEIEEVATVEEPTVEVSVKSKNENIDTGLFNMSILDFKTAKSKEYMKYNSAKGFVPVKKLTWEELADRTVNSFCAYTPYWLKNGHRTLENVRGSTDIIILDVDETNISIKNMHKILKDINHIISTTSNVNNKFKYRVLIQLDQKIDLPPRKWKVFYKSIGELIGAKTDSNINKAGMFIGYGGSEYYVVSGKDRLSTKSHLIKAYDSEDIVTEIVPIAEGDHEAFNALWDNRFEEFKFAYEATNGNRSIMLNAARYRATQLNLQKETIEELLREINDYILDGPIPIRDLEETIIKYI